MTLSSALVTLTATAVLLVAAVVVDRLLLWMEARGWLHYRRTRLNYQGGRRAMVQLGAFLEPAKEHVIELEEKLEQQRDDDDEGDARGKTRPTYDSVRDSES